LDTLVTVHSLVRWLVLVALIGGFVLAFGASRRPGEAFANPVYSGVVMVVDLQVTLGLILWLFNNGWDQNAFMAYFHPVAMLLALGVAHMAILRGRGIARNDHPAANRVVGIGFAIAFVLIISAVPWDRL
jgi:hypothetical protein